MAEQTKTVARLVPANDEADLCIDLQEGVNRIGRQRVDNHIVLVSPQVSRFHAEIEVKPSEIVLRDLGSANGTFVNGEQIKHRVIKADDTIGFSDQFTLRLEVESAAPAQEPDSIMLPARPKDPAANAVVRPKIDDHAIPESLARRSAELDLDNDFVEASQTSGGVGFSQAELARKSAAKPASESGVELHVFERERQQLSTLFQISRRCMEATTLQELDRLLINVLERTVVFDRGFIAYQLPSGDWKLVMAPKGIHWDRDVVRDLLQISSTASDMVVVSDSRTDPTLGQPEQGSDKRLLIPLRNHGNPVGMMFVISNGDPLRTRTVDFLSLFSDIAAMAILHCAQLPQSH